MSGVPYIRFFGDDWLSGTQDLSLEERGALVTIVALTAATGQPPALDFQRLARRFGCTPGKAKKVIAALEDLGKIAIEGNAVHNARALSETEFSQKKSEKQSENASARWSKKSEKSNKNNDRPDAMAVPRECQPEPEPELKKKEAKASSKKSRKTSMPEDAICSPELIAIAAEEGHGEAEALAQFDRFKSSALANGRKYASWKAAWRNWFRSDYFRPVYPKHVPINGGSYDNRTHKGAAPARRPENRPDAAFEQALRLAGLGEA